MSTRNLDYLFRPRSVAVIGASNKQRTVGAAVMRNLLDGGFAGPVLPVSTEYDTVAGVLAYRTVSQLRVTPDLGVICTPPETVPRIVADLGARGTRGVILLTAGLGTTPHDPGRSVLQTTLDEARGYLVRILGPEGIGLAVPALGLNASLAASKPLPGKIALLSQSSAVTAGLLDWATRHGIGFSHVVSFGESADVDVGDVLDYLGSDPDTRALLLYIESIAAARKFMSAGRAAARNKPVIVLKPEPGNRFSAEFMADAEAASTDQVFDAAVRRAGMLRVGSLLDLFGAAEALARARPLRGDRIAVLTNGRALGTLASATLAAGDSSLAAFADETARALQALLPADTLPANPVDLPGDTSAERYARTLGTLLSDSGIDAVLLVHAPSAMVPSEEIARACVPIATATERTVLSCWLGGPAVAGAHAVVSQAGLSAYHTPEEAARALSHLVEYRRNQEALRQTPPSLPGDFAPDVEAAHRIVARVLAEGREVLTEFEARSLLLAYQIPVVETHFVESAGDAVRIADQLGYPVALKVVSPDVVHRSEVGGVMVNLEDAEEVRLAARDIAKRLETLRPGTRLAGYTVQRMIRRRGTDSPRVGAVELAIGVARDAFFGPVIHLDLGGAVSKAVHERAVALPPLNMTLAAELVFRTRAAKLVAGHPDRRVADPHAVCSALVKLSQLAVDIPEVVEFLVDPLFADEKGVLAMETRARVRAPTTRGTDHLAIHPYPKELEEAVECAGQLLTLRPIRGEDSVEHEEFVARIDPDDLRFRFGREIRQLPRSELARMTQIDYEREMAFIATVTRDNGRPETVGEVRVSIEPDGARAELAIVVRSDFQGRGLGRALAEKMLRYCRERRVRTLYGLVSASNARMLALASRLGFEVEHVPGGETAIISLDLGRWPEPPSVKLF